MKRALILLLLCLVFPLAQAQSVTGTLVGTARDAGGVIAGAHLTVTSQGTGIKWDAVTNENGDYVVPNLPAGQYRIRAEHPGYRSITVENIRLLLNATVRNDLTFEVGQLSETVEVTARAPVVQSETSSVALVIDTHAIESLPVNGRTLDMFLFTAAGNASTDSASNPKIGGSQHWGGSLFTVNGVTINDLGNGGGAYSYATSLATQPSLDTIQEFKVESNSAKAEYGGSVAVSILTKSGSNEIHGSVYEFNRNRELAANAFFNNTISRPRQPFNRNEFGASAGGPIVKNRTFFFFSYEGLRLVPGEELEWGAGGRTRLDGTVINRNFQGPLRHHGWTLEADREATLTWPVFPYNPYRNGPETALERAVGVISFPLRLPAERERFVRPDQQVLSLRLRVP